MKRYIFLSAVAIVMLLLAACAPAPTATEAPAAEEPAEEPAAEEAPAEEVTAEVEIFSWWTSGGEAAALQSLFDAYNARWPDVELINATVAGGGGSAAKAVLQTRLTGGDPPDTWQLHPGAELVDKYVIEGYVEPITDIYEEEGWFDVMPAGLVEQMSYQGEVYALLVGIHRGNVLWYNKRVLDDNGVEVPATFDEFFAAAETLQGAGVTPLCLGNSEKFPGVQLLETVLMGTLGAEGYKGLWDGSTAWDSAEAREALDTYSKMLDYTNTDYSAFGWSAAVERVINGECAFNIMGDWAYGDFVANEQEPGVDFGWTAAPGNDGIYDIVGDGFPLAANAPNQENARNWIRVLGSKEAQEAFNPLKGSIPARTDVDRAKFGDYHNWAMDAFAADGLVPTVTHGSAAVPSYQEALYDAVQLFIVDRDVDAIIETMTEAATEAGVGG